MLSIKKLTSIPTPNGLGKYLPEMLYFVKQGSTVSIYLTDTVGDGLYQVNTGGGGGGTSMSTYFISDGGMIPSNLNPSDVIIETTNGLSSGKALRAWQVQSNQTLLLIVGEHRVQGGVVANDVGNSANATIAGGRYIVPSSGTSNAFVGHENELALYNGSTFFFIEADVGDVYYVSQGTNQGKYLTWNGTTWDEQGIRTNRGIHPWVQSLPWYAGDIVIRGDALYTANDTMVSGEAFVLGEVGATWKPLVSYQKAGNTHGEYVVSASLKVTSATPATLVTINLPSKGVWKIDSMIRANNDQTVVAANGVSYALYDDQGVLVANSEVKASHASTPEGYQSIGVGRSFVTITEAKTYTLKVWRTGTSGEPYVLSDGNGRSKVTFEKIADE